MDLGLSEEQELLKNFARDFLEKECPEQHVRDMEEDEQGYVWALESVYRTQTGIYVFTRATRREGEPDQRVVVLGNSPDELVIAIKGQLGMPPGRLEVLGRAGIEIGLEPDNDIEGDELEGPIPD